MESSVYNFWPPTGKQCDGSKWYIGTVAAESGLGKIAFNSVYYYNIFYPPEYFAAAC